MHGAIAEKFEEVTQDCPAGGELMPRHTVEAIVALRNEALKKFGEAYIALAAASQAQAVAAAAWKKAAPTNTDRFTISTRNEKIKFIDTIQMVDEAEYLKTARRLVDIDVWAHVIKITDLERLMDKQARDEFQKSLADNPPEATVENITATLHQFASTAGDVFKRGIANAFSKLDRRFKSHDGFKVGARVILDRLFKEDGYYNWHHDKEATLADIERTFLVLDEKPVTANYAGIVGALRADKKFRPEQGLVESEYFRIRYFMNGNAHLWMKRKDLVEKVNKLLAEWYGEVIGDGMQAEEDPFKNVKTTPAKRFGFFPTPDDAAKRLLEGFPLLRSADKPQLRILEPSAGTGNLARLCIQRPIAITGMMPDWERERIVRHNAEHRFDNQVDCIEIQVEHALALRKERIYSNVYCTDFLTFEPDPAKLYDRVLMNPPFDLERDIDHVVHALKFLKDDGCLAAIMSAGTEFRETKKAVAFRAMVKKMGARFYELPAGSFSSVGTNCNTVMLHLWKDGRHRFY